MVGNREINHPEFNLPELAVHASVVSVNEPLIIFPKLEVRRVNDPRRIDACYSA